MGSYAYLTLGVLTLSSSKREPDPSILAVFREGDRLELPFPAEAWDGDPDDMPRSTLRYVATLGAVRDRLELMGITLAAVTEAFGRGIKEERERPETVLPAGVPLIDHIVQAQREERDLLASLTFAIWLRAFGEVARGTYKDADLYAEDQLQIPPLYRRILRHPFEYLFGFPAVDYRYFLRAVAEDQDPELELVYDLTELIAYEYVQPDEALADWAARMLASDYQLAQKIVVLTEGSIDRWVISSSIDLLYPHLAEFFAFLDFDGMKVPGGAGFLAATVKAFAAAGIANRVIAVFDNDTAGHSAMRHLHALKLPDNIRVVPYPAIPLMRSYPTLGPSGLFELDVNGLAGSIELYFGEDVLRRDDGTLTPVQWRGFDEGLGRYQGEVIEKRRLHERFRAKLQGCRSLGDRALLRQNMADLETLVDAIRGAFN